SPGGGDFPRLQQHDPGGAGRAVALCHRAFDRQRAAAGGHLAAGGGPLALPGRGRASASACTSDPPRGGGAVKQRIWNLKLQPKLLLGLVVMAAVLAAALTPTISRLYRRQMESYYTQLAFDQASIAASLIDGDRIRNYYPSGEKDAYYEQVRQYLLTV